MDHAAKGGDGANLLADELLDFFEEIVGWDGGVGVVRRGEGDEGKGEMAFERVGNADNTAFGNGRMGGDGLFDGA